MATVKKGMLTYADEWAKHLKPWGRRLFWKGERQAGKQAARNEIRQSEDGPPKGRPSHLRSSAARSHFPSIAAAS
jgi:hypothetical protein